MCGIVGYWNHGNADACVVEQMASQIKNRGPDDAGVWLDEVQGVALAHRRLSVLDLSQAGHQPMTSPCERYVLVYNGEIYNHQDLRRELEITGGAFDWRGHSDTETLLAALRHWGLKGALKRINGMFAFALWDASEKTLYLARDRMGEKPLYYGRCAHVFLFGSELKALTKHPDWSAEIDRDALALYMRHNYVPAPKSIYKGIEKLPPAHFVAIRAGGSQVGEPQCYWNLGLVAEQGVSITRDDPVALTNELDALLRDAIKRRMSADVPLGAFLSGGYDSSTVAALMQAQSLRPIQTFSIGFYDEGYNEAPHAKAVAERLGSNHHELYVTSKQAMEVIPQLPTIFDEPFSDSSQIPTFLVSQLARQHVTVCLSGDGGDELFYGYQRYRLASQIWNKLRVLPAFVRKGLAWWLNHLPGASLNRIQSSFPNHRQVAYLSDRLHKLAEVLSHNDEVSFYHALVSHAKSPEQIVIGASEPETIFNRQDRMPRLPSFCERMMYLDMITYLPSDILTKVDRATMAVSLEARVPLLDHRIVEFAWNVPMEYKYRFGQQKWLLREVLHHYIPKKLMERPKMGFGIPIEHWLRGPLRDWAENLLDEKRLRDEGYLNPMIIRKMWAEHCAGKRRWHYFLWDVLIFQAWHEKMLER